MAYNPNDQTKPNVLDFLKTVHRFQHRHILGKSGVGKSTTLLNLILADVAAGDGVFYIDPHGEDADRLLEHIPKARQRDVILFDPSDLEHPAPINVLENVLPEHRPLMASSLVDTVKSVWGYDQLATPVLDQYVYNATAALLDAPNATLLGLLLMLCDDAFREAVIVHCTDPVVRRFWDVDYRALSTRERRETSRSTLNKIGMLMADSRIRSTFGYPKSAVRLEEVFNGKVLIARLPQGRLGLQKTRMIGALLLARFHMLALGRDQSTKSGRDDGTFRPCHLYLDECHLFGTSTVTEMLSGIRKFGISLTLCHQYLDQLSPALRDAVLGTVGTRIVFRVGLADATILDREFPVDNTFPSVAELAPFTARISTPDTLFRELSMPALPAMNTVPKEHNKEAAAAIRRFSLRHYTRSRARVERVIHRMLQTDPKGIHKEQGRQASPSRRSA